jgi:CRP-like cAMP-binding protein
MASLARQLSDVEVFKELPEDERTALAAQATHYVLQPGAFLCRQGDQWPHIIYLAAGRLRWSMISAGGQQYTILTTEPGRLMWGHSLFDGQPMPASITATETADIHMWSREQVAPVFSRYPGTLWAILRLQTLTMRRAREIIYGLAFQPVAGRLAKLLLDRYGHQQMPAGRDMTLNEIAAMVASSPEVVCRLLHHFQNDGILEITRAQITLHNSDALEKLLEGA